MVRHPRVPWEGKNPPPLPPAHPQNARRGPSSLHATPCHAARQKPQRLHPLPPRRVGTAVSPARGVGAGLGCRCSPPSHPQLPAASHLLGVLAVLSIAAPNIAMKFPVCASPAAAAGLLRACGQLREASSPRPPQPPPWRGRPAGLGCCWPLSACSLPTVSSSLLSPPLLSAPLLPSSPGETRLAGARRPPRWGCAAAPAIWGVWGGGLVTFSPGDFGAGWEPNPHRVGFTRQKGDTGELLF